MTCRFRELQPLRDAAIRALLAGGLRPREIAALDRGDIGYRHMFGVNDCRTEQVAYLRVKRCEEMRPAVDTAALAMVEQRVEVDHVHVEIRNGERVIDDEAAAPLLGRYLAARYDRLPPLFLSQRFERLSVRQVERIAAKG